MNSFNNLSAVNCSKKRISLSEDVFQYSITLNYNAKNISLGDRELYEFDFIQSVLQSHILSDVDLSRMHFFLNCNTKIISLRKGRAHHFLS